MGYDNQKNDHLKDNALIFQQILSASFSKKRMETSRENFYVDIAA